MSKRQDNSMAGLMADRGEILVVVGIVFVVGLLVLPLPTIMLDLFLALSIASSLMVLLVALNADRPLDFSSFPAVLLLLTLYRLALNVSSTRLILGRGEAGAAARRDRRGAGERRGRAGARAALAVRA